MNMVLLICSKRPLHTRNNFPASAFNQASELTFFGPFIEVAHEMKSEAREQPGFLKEKQHSLVISLYCIKEHGAGIHCF